MNPELKKLLLVQIAATLIISAAIGLLLVAFAYWMNNREAAGFVAFLCAWGCYFIARCLGNSVDKGIKRYDADKARASD